MSRILSYEETLKAEEELNVRLDKAQKMIKDGLSELNEVMWEMQKITQPVMRAYYGHDSSTSSKIGEKENE